MAIKLKPLFKQVIFITGATSSIGLATVHMAVEQGAKVFMVDQNEDDLQRLQDEMRAKGYDTAYAVADEEQEQLQFAADQCVTTFGAIDCWINNAATASQGPHLNLTTEESKAMFETNFWGFVNGSKIAINYLKDNGGSLINVGSTVDESEVNVRGLISASRHAVKGYTDGLRKELKAEGIPISVSLVLPGAIKTNMEKEEVSPVTSQDVVARAILRCAQRPTNEVGAGVTKQVLPMMEKIIPKIQKYFQQHPERKELMTSKKSWIASGALALGGAFLFLKKSRII